MSHVHVTVKDVIYDVYKSRFYLNNIVTVMEYIGPSHDMVYSWDCNQFHYTNLF